MCSNDVNLCMNRDDGEMKPDGKRVTTSRDGPVERLWISDLGPADAGVYTCVARSESGVTRCSTELSVFDKKPAKDSYLQPPIFVEGLVPKRTAHEGERVQLTVKLQGTRKYYDCTYVTCLRQRDCDIRFTRYRILFFRKEDFDRDLNFFSFSPARKYLSVVYFIWSKQILYYLIKGREDIFMTKVQRN